MPRVARIVLEDVPHHVTQRGNNRADIFFSPRDRNVYFAFLVEYCRRFDVSLDGYCLMTNHVHLILTPSHVESLSLAVGGAHHAYAMHVNLGSGRSGHLWQGRFYSCPLDDAHFLSAMRYIERNPVRTGIAELPWEYPWSSADIHSGKRNNDAMLSMKNWTNCIGGMDWTAVLCEGEAEEELVEIRKKTQSGLPWADMAFIRKMEEKTGRRLGPAH